MLRTENLTSGGKALALGLMAAVGALAAWLVVLGNPGNMGLCGACFLRDTAGAMGLFAKGPAVFRPEVAGLLLGALLWALAKGGFTARSGGHAAARFVLGLWMGVGALVFLGCPFRLLQRLGGGDLNAWMALPGFVAGVFLALQFEKRGYTVGKTAPAPAAVGLLGPVGALALLALYLKGGTLLGPGPGDAAGKPPHAPWMASLAIAGGAGLLLSATGFCAVNAVRQLFQPRKLMLAAAAALVLGYAAVALAGGKFHLASAGQPIAHGDWLWNFLGLALLGLAGALAGGCPVRQMVMAGEGNGDAFLGVVGIAAGGALAHNWGLVSAAATAEAAGGATAHGKIAVVVGLVGCAVYAVASLREGRARGS